MVSVVIPTYNRGTSLEYVCLVLTEYLAENYESYEVILVDDGSGDHTAKVIGQLCQQYKHVKGLVLEANVGQQNATLAGIRITTKPLVITMDDDLRYGLKGIKTLIEKLHHGSSTKEIAEKLSIKERSVSHYLSTGLKKLRLLLTSRQVVVDDFL